MKSLSRCARHCATNSNTIPKDPSLLSIPRQKYPELSSLSPIPPKAAKHVSLNRTEPASLAPMIFQAPAYGGVLNPSYQAINGGNAYRKCPSATNKLFSAKIVPHELLSHVEPDKLPPFPNSPLSPAFAEFGSEGGKIRYRSKMDKANVVYASFLISTSKAKVHDHAVIRRKTAKRIREALYLIVIRGARASDSGNSIVFNGEDSGEDKWLAKGWSYVLFPTLEAYRAPWPSLLTNLRESLVTLNLGAKKLSQGSTKNQGSSMWGRGKNIIGKSAPPKSSTVPYRAARPLQGSAKAIPRIEGETANPESPRNMTQSPPSLNSISSSNASKTSRIIASTSSSLGKQVPHPRKWTTTKPKPPNTRSYSTGRAPDPEAHNRKRNMRGETVLGGHSRLSPKDALVALETSPFSDSEGLLQVTHEQLEHWEDAQYFFEEDPFSSREADSADIWVDAYDSDDAEGWVIAGDRLPQGDLDIPYLLDSSNISRFISPNLPHHAGRGFERNLRRLWKYESAEIIKEKFETAVIQRRGERKALRNKWNQIDPEWLSALRQREEQRLENMYGRSPNSKGNVQAKPWWAPSAGDLGWAERAAIGVEETHSPDRMGESSVSGGHTVHDTLTDPNDLTSYHPRETRRLKWSDRVHSENTVGNSSDI